MGKTAQASVSRFENMFMPILVNFVVAAVGQNIFCIREMKFFALSKVLLKRPQMSPKQTWEKFYLTFQQTVS